MSKVSLRTSSTRMLPHRTNKWTKKDLKLKPFGFCCSLDRFDPLSRYDQKRPPYKSSLMAITSVHECPVSKMQMTFLTPRLIREKRRLKASEAGDQQRLKNGKLSYFPVGKNDRSLKWYLEDEIALAKDMFWTEKQRIYNEASDKATRIGKEKVKSAMQTLLNLKYPRWYQDFSLNQMKNLINLENVMRIDYEETKTDGTQRILMAIGIISTFFKLKPNIINELHKSSKLNSVDFLREIYKILTGNDFHKEEYKKFYDCNERLILSAIAFLTLPETVRELHKRLPPMIIPSLPSKPKSPKCPTRRKSKCPYKEDLFKYADWASYRNALQKWQKQYKLLQGAKRILSSQFFIDGEILSDIRKQKKDIYTDCEKTSINDLQKSSSTLSYSKGVPKPPAANKKSWLGEKNPHYMIAGASLQDEKPLSCPVIYEITGIANVTPTNSDEKFFSILKLDDGPKKIFPSGRENLSRKWQDWLQNADEDFKQIEEKADELMKSVQTTMKLVFPGPVCDNCCSCRQTRKTEKLQNSKVPIDNAVQNNEKNMHVVESMQSLTPESPINLNASQNEIETNLIINGVTKENGKTQYYISGFQSDKIHIPSRIPDSSAPQLVRNVPPCSCAIQQMADKDVSPSISEDDIPWTKDEGICIGKKYRPDVLGALSCKTYPGDKSCRHNPFTEEIIKMEKKKKEKGRTEEEKEKTISIEMVKKENQMKKITEKKKDKFIPDPNYPAYDNPWNILRTAPSKVIEADYEKTLKLTPPAFFTISSSLNVQERQEDISSLQELKRIEKDILQKENSEKISKISSKLPKKIKTEKGEKLEDMKKKKRKEWILSKKIAVNKKSTNLSSKISKSTCRTKKKQRTKLSSFYKSIKSPDRVGKKLPKYGFIKKDKKDVVDETKQFENRKQEMARLKNMFKSFAVLDNIQPAILLEELLTTSRSDPEKVIDSSVYEKESRAISKDPCGWRTKSEQELPAKKTLAYLCEPDYPLETVAVRPGGRPCHCRENRNKKKILMYNVGGLVEEKRYGRRARKTKIEEENRIINGVFYSTPPISPRRSDEYIPEYELFESPYDMCINHVPDERLKLIERYSGPKSLVEKIQKKPKSCSCSNGAKKENHLVTQNKNIAEIRRKLMESKSPEERWKTALKDEALMDYFTQHKNNVPCWTSYKKFAQSVRPRKLKIVKPVCECKYERKVVERNEEKTKWRTRQGRLKASKKQPFMHIVDVSRPMIQDTKFVISGVKTMLREDKQKEDIKYCISDVAEDVSLSTPQQIIDGLKMSSPFQTPQPSREDISVAVPHRHWSPINIPPGPLPRLKEEMERRKKARDEAFKMIYGDNNEQDVFCLHRNYQEICDKKKLMTCHEMKENHMDIEKKMSEKIIGLQSPSKKMSNEIEHRKNISQEKIASEVFHEKKKYMKEAIDEIAQQDISYKQIIDKISEKTDDERNPITNDDEKHTDSKLNLMAIIKAELKKMAAEGYIFAKLPKCYLMPQLQDWITYRQCVTFSETDKKNLMRATVQAWQLIEEIKMPIDKPSLHMTKTQLEKLTYKHAEEIKEKIQETRAIFHSKQRKARVSYARSMWSTMEFGQFPSMSFKRTFFTYMASKEADGHVYKPWMPSEVNEPNPEFCCY